jgi:hypothetical protein
MFERNVLANATHLTDRMRHVARRRSLLVFDTFMAAMLVAFFAPRIGFGLICAALLLHLRPEAASSRQEGS